LLLLRLLLLVLLLLLFLDIAVLVDGNTRLFLVFVPHVRWDKMRPRHKQSVGVHIADLKLATLEFGHQIGNAVALVVHGLAENVLWDREPNVLVRRLVSRRKRDPLVNSIQELVENGHLLQVAAMPLLVQRINVNLAHIVVVFDKQKT